MGWPSFVATLAFGVMLGAGGTFVVYTPEDNAACETAIREQTAEIARLRESMLSREEWLAAVERQTTPSVVNVAPVVAERAEENTAVSESPVEKNQGESTSPPPTAEQVQRFSEAQLAASRVFSSGRLTDESARELSLLLRELTPDQAMEIRLSIARQINEGRLKMESRRLP